MSPSSGRLSAKKDPPCQYPDDSMRALAQEPRKSPLDEHWRQSEYRLVHSSRAQALEQQVPLPGDQRQKLAGRPDDSMGVTADDAATWRSREADATAS